MAVVTKKCYYSNTSKITLFDFYSSIQSQEALGTSTDDAHAEQSSNLVELDKEQLQMRIQQQQLREQEVVQESIEEDLEPKSDEEDVDDEAKDEDSKRHDIKMDEVPSADSLNDLDQIEEQEEEADANEIEEDEDSDYEPFLGQLSRQNSKISAIGVTVSSGAIINEICDFVMEEYPSVNDIKYISTMRGDDITNLYYHYV